MENVNKILLHVGCADRGVGGFINSDKLIISRRSGASLRDKTGALINEMDISKPWPYADESVDGIISMGVLQCLSWRELLVALRESFRVLKKGGIMRIGVPLVENTKRTLDYLLGWNNINLFSYDLLKRVLERVGYLDIKMCNYRETSMPEFACLDNRPEQIFYIEMIK